MEAKFSQRHRGKAMSSLCFFCFFKYNLLIFFLWGNVAEQRTEQRVTAGVIEQHSESLRDWDLSNVLLYYQLSEHFSGKCGKICSGIGKIFLSFTSWLYVTGIRDYNHTVYNDKLDDGEKKKKHFRLLAKFIFVFLCKVNCTYRHFFYRLIHSYCGKETICKYSLLFSFSFTAATFACVDRMCHFCLPILLKYFTDWCCIKYSHVPTTATW